MVLLEGRGEGANADPSKDIADSVCLRPWLLWCPLDTAAVAGKYSADELAHAYLKLVQKMMD